MLFCQDNRGNIHRKHASFLSKWYINLSMYINIPKHFKLFDEFRQIRSSTVDNGRSLYSTSISKAKALKWILAKYFIGCNLCTHRGYLVLSSKSCKMQVVLWDKYSPWTEWVVVERKKEVVHVDIMITLQPDRRDAIVQIPHTQELHNHPITMWISHACFSFLPNPRHWVSWLIGHFKLFVMWRVIEYREN